VEARLNHVTGNEWAEEGLLMIRLSPDGCGKYGFIVKVGFYKKEELGRASSISLFFFNCV